MAGVRFFYSLDAVPFTQSTV